MSRQHQPRSTRAALLTAGAMVTVTAALVLTAGCGSDKGVSCSLEKCTVTVTADQSVNGVLGSSLKLEKVTKDSADITLAGTTVTVPLNGEATAGDFKVTLVESDGKTAKFDITLA